MMNNKETPTQRLWNNQRLLRALAIVLVLMLIIAIVLLSDHLPNYKSVGYLGVFVLSFVGSASVLVPVPGIAAVCAGADPDLVGLFPLLVALLASVAESLGDAPGFPKVAKKEPRICGSCPGS